MAHRFFLSAPLPLQPGQPLPLSPSDAHHAVRVLRVRPGERIELVGLGGEVTNARVVSAGDDGVVVTVSGAVVTRDEQLPRVTLFQGVAKGEKMDTIVRQAVEVGAEEIVAVMMSRTVVRLDAVKRASRQERWQRIAKSAAEQAKRSGVPSVSEPVTFTAALGLLGDYERVVVLWENHRGPGLSDALSGLGSTAGARVALVVGPEGGLCTEEVEALVARGAIVASLGPTIMRTETAAVVSVALALAALGGMGGST